MSLNVCHLCCNCTAWVYLWGISSCWNNWLLNYSCYLNWSLVYWHNFYSWNIINAKDCAYSINKFSLSISIEEIWNVHVNSSIKLNAVGQGNSNLTRFIGSDNKMNCIIIVKILIWAANWCIQRVLSIIVKQGDWFYSFSCFILNSYRVRSRIV